SLKPDNYCTIMIGHTLAKLFATVLDDYISQWAEKKHIKVKGQTGFRRNHRTNDHIFTLVAIIEEAKAKKQK
ncbi:hypothetical protein KI387_030261, partial [Taxus chinensis]